jgi:DNA-binding CsgD family transcriptional regulator
MLHLVYHPEKKTWIKSAKSLPQNPGRSQQQWTKLLLDVFSVGEYFYLITEGDQFNTYYLGSAPERFLGFSAQNLNLQFLLSRISSADRNKVNALIQNLSVQNEEDVQLALGIRNHLGITKRILLQIHSLPYLAEDQLLWVFVDISYLKTNSRPEIYIERRSLNSGSGRPLSKQSVLSKRQTEILACIAAGLTNDEISDRLHIAENTVLNHRKGILKALKSKSVNGAIRKAFELKIDLNLR